MPQPIPPYLIALAVGDIAFEPLGPRTAFGPSLPFSMPRPMNFPTWKKCWKRLKISTALTAGSATISRAPAQFSFWRDGKSAHDVRHADHTGWRSQPGFSHRSEVAHSWSGNLVTNATWSDFWLNEGYTVYIERRILEHIYGTTRAEMEAMLGYEELKRELAEHPPGDQILHIDLAGRDPDDGVTQIPYEKERFRCARSRPWSAGSASTSICEATSTGSRSRASRRRRR